MEWVGLIAAVIISFVFGSRGDWFDPFDDDPGVQNRTNVFEFKSVLGVLCVLFIGVALVLWLQSLKNASAEVPITQSQPVTSVPRRLPAAQATHKTVPHSHNGSSK